jgi:hypothetical protein
VDLAGETARMIRRRWDSRSFEENTALYAVQPFTKGRRHLLDASARLQATTERRRLLRHMLVGQRFRLRELPKRERAD